MFLYTESRLLPAVMAADQAMRSTLRAGSPNPIFFHTEFLDTSLFVGDASAGEVRTLLQSRFRQKYPPGRIDLVIAGGDRALRIALGNRGRLFPDVPVVFIIGESPATVADLKLGADVTGLWANIPWAETLDVALRLQPETRRVVVVAGTARPDRYWLSLARAQLAPYASRVTIDYLTDLSLEEVLDRVGKLAPGTILMPGSFLRDSTGRDFIGADVVGRIVAASSVPAYTITNTVIGEGAVGGYVMDWKAIGEKAGALALRVLGGERPPATDVRTSAHVFDWRQLRRWRLDERRLPPDSVVQFRPPSAWGLYKWYIVGVIALVGAQSALIGGLLLQRRQRRHAREALAERLRFETLLAALSAVFVNLPARDVGTEITRGLQLIVEALELDRANLTEVGPGGVVHVRHSWTRKGVEPLPATVQGGDFPWIRSRLLAGHVVSLSRPEELPAEAAVDRSSLAAHGTRSLAVVRLMVGGSMVGTLSFVTLRAERAWPDELVQGLRLLGEVFANALARREAEAAARESEERLRLIADSAPVMVWTSGPDGLVTHVNKGWLDFTGRHIDQELGNGWSDLVHPDDRDQCLMTIEAALKHGHPFTVEYRLRRWDGVYRWLLYQGVPFTSRTGAVVGFIGSAIDVTALKDAEHVLRESDALRSAVLGSLYGQVAALDRQGVVVAVNEPWTTFAERYEAARQAVSVGANYVDACRQAAASGDANAAHTLEAILAVLDGGRRAPFECVIPSPAGDRWVEITVEPFQRPEGGVVVSRVDVTRRRRAEEDARRQREELAHALRVTTLGELAGSIAHELIQPLAAIMANTQAARRLLASGRRADGDAAEVTEALADVVADTRRAGEVIHHLRALFRKEDGKREEVDLNVLVDRVVRLTLGQIERRDIVVRRVLAKNLPPVLADPVQIQQVLLNLLVNAGEAIAAAGDGPRTIEIRTGSPEPDVVQIAVQDSGIGVGEEALERMFERFVSTKPGGLGMGLTISRSLVQAQGGRIWANRNIDRGITMFVELPAARKLET